MEQFADGFTWLQSQKTRRSQAFQIERGTLLPPPNRLPYFANHLTVDLEVVVGAHLLDRLMNAFTWNGHSQALQQAAIGGASFARVVEQVIGKLGGIKATALALQITESDVQRYRRGKRIPKSQTYVDLEPRIMEVSGIKPSIIRGGLLATITQRDYQDRILFPSLDSRRVLLEACNLGARLTMTRSRILANGKIESPQGANLIGPKVSKLMASFGETPQVTAKALGIRESELRLLIGRPDASFAGLVRAHPDLLENLSTHFRHPANKLLGLLGLEIAHDHEAKEENTPRYVQRPGYDPGYDLESFPDGVSRKIEVKAMASSRMAFISMTTRECQDAERFGDQYFLYLILNPMTNPVMLKIQNPYKQLLDSSYELNKPNTYISLSRVHALNGTDAGTEQTGQVKELLGIATENDSLRVIDVPSE